MCHGWRFNSCLWLNIIQTLRMCCQSQLLRHDHGPNGSENKFIFQRSKHFTILLCCVFTTPVNQARHCNYYPHSSDEGKSDRTMRGRENLASQRLPTVFTAKAKYKQRNSKSQFSHSSTTLYLSLDRYFDLFTTVKVGNKLVKMIGECNSFWKTTELPEELMLYINHYLILTKAWKVTFYLALWDRCCFYVAQRNRVPASIFWNHVEWTDEMTASQAPVLVWEATMTSVHLICFQNRLWWSNIQWQLCCKSNIRIKSFF